MSPDQWKLHLGNLTLKWASLKSNGEFTGHAHNVHSLSTMHSCKAEAAGAHQPGRP